MPDYESLYYQLFAAVTDAMELLKKASLETEATVIAPETEKKPTPFPFLIRPKENAEE